MAVAARLRAATTHENGGVKSGALPRFGGPSQSERSASRASSSSSCSQSSDSFAAGVARTTSLLPTWSSARSKCTPCWAQARTCASVSATLAPDSLTLTTSASGKSAASSPAIDSSGWLAPTPTPVLSPRIRMRGPWAVRRRSNAAPRGELARPLNAAPERCDLHQRTATDQQRHEIERLGQRQRGGHEGRHGPKSCGLGISFAHPCCGVSARMRDDRAIANRPAPWNAPAFSDAFVTPDPPACGHPTCIRAARSQRHALGGERAAERSVAGRGSRLRPASGRSCRAAHGCRRSDAHRAHRPQQPHAAGVVAGRRMPAPPRRRQADLGGEARRCRRRDASPRAAPRARAAARAAAGPQ